MLGIFQIIERINWKITYLILGIVLIILKINDLIGTKLLIILIVISIFIPIIVFIFKERYLLYKYYPLDYKFMYEFLKITGILGKSIVKKYSDNSHKLSKLKKLFIIDGSDCYTEKLFKGTNMKSELSDGIKIWIGGGSSTSFESLGIETFDITNNTIQTKPKLLDESERTKSILIPFNEPIKPNAQFELKYIENHWFGAMRCDFDGLICNEHMLFKYGVNEYEVNIIFKLGKLNYVTAYHYDLKTNKIYLEDIKVEKLSEMEYKWTKENPENEKIYLLMYRYAEIVKKADSVKHIIG